jgi:hypothetical protein
MLTRQLSAYRMHLWSLAGFNILVGFTLVSLARRGIVLMLALVVAFAIHVLRTDEQLTSTYRERFDGAARLVLGGTVLVGAALALPVAASFAFVSLSTALVLGGIGYSLLRPDRLRRRRGS